MRLVFLLCLVCVANSGAVKFASAHSWYEAACCSSSVMGRVASSPRVIVTSPGSCFCSWSARGCHIMRSERRRQAHLRRVIHSRECSRHYLRLCRFLRPSDGTSGERSRSRPAPNLLLLPVYAAAASRPQRNVVPFTHMRCKMTASLRANATFARFMPRRRATSSAQRLRAEKRTARVSRMCAPS